MSKVKVNDINMNYEKQGSGEPLILIPFTSADNACYAFQFPDYSKHLTCISVDTRGVGETDKPKGPYSTEQYADDIAGLMQALGIEKAHIAGVSLGAVTGMQLAAKYPDRVKSLSLHSGWTKTDPFLKTIVEGWQLTAKAIGNVAETVIKFIFPWCFTPDLYAAKPDYIKALSDFVRGRPAQPVDAFLSQCDAVLSHDCESKLGKIKAPTLITFGDYDMVTSPGRFANIMKNNIKNSELVIFEHCSHAGLYEKTEEFNQKTLDFLKRHSG
jgi:3-oxoadipate enol-lactonase